MKFKATLHALNFDKDAWLRQLKDEMTEHVSKMAAGYLIAALDAIPKWSAASYITFLKLAQTIQFTVNVTPAPSSNDWPIKANRNRSEAARDSDGYMTIDEKQGLFTFTYTTSYSHLVYNEYNNVNLVEAFTQYASLKRPGPWNFQEAAKKAAFNDLEVSVPVPNLVGRPIKA